MTEKITNNKKANHTENQGRKRNNHCNKSTRYAEQLIFSICVYYTALGDLLCTPGQDSTGGSAMHTRAGQHWGICYAHPGWTALGDLLCTPGQDSSKKGFNILVYGGVNSTIIL